MEDLDAASLEDVEQFFRTYYAPNNAVLTICGDFDAGAREALVERYFGDIPRGPPIPPLPGATECRRARRRRRATGASRRSRCRALYVAYRTPPYGTDELLRGAVVAQILGYGQGRAAVPHAVREQRLAQDVVAYAFPIVVGASDARAVGDGAAGRRAGRARGALHEQIEALRRRGRARCRARGRTDRGAPARGPADGRRARRPAVDVSPRSSTIPAASTPSSTASARSPPRTCALRARYLHARQSRGHARTCRGGEAGEAWHDEPRRASSEPCATAARAPVRSARSSSRRVAARPARQRRRRCCTRGMATCRWSRCTSSSTRAAPTEPTSAHGLARSPRTRSRGRHGRRSAGDELAWAHRALGIELAAWTHVGRGARARDRADRAHRAGARACSRTSSGTPAFPPNEVERAARRAARRDHAAARRAARARRRHGDARSSSATARRTRARSSARRERCARYARDDVARVPRARVHARARDRVVVGDIDRAGARALAAAPFGDWQGSAAAPARVRADRALERTTVIHRRPARLRAVGAAHRPRRRAAHAPPTTSRCIVMNTILGGAFTSRLNLNLREKHGFTYGVRSGFAYPPPARSVRDPDRRRHRRDRRARSRRSSARSSALREGGPRRRSVANARTTSPASSRSSCRPPRSSPARLAELVIYDLPARLPRALPRRILAVSADDVLARARTYLRPDRLAVVVVGDARGRAAARGARPRRRRPRRHRGASAEPRRMSDRRDQAGPARHAPVHDGRIVHLSIDTVRFPDGIDGRARDDPPLAAPPPCCPS